MQTILTTTCDCCGLSVQGLVGDDCPRCNYPLSPLKERNFLIAAVSDLERVARYGGAQLTVQTLIQRYQRRLVALRQPVTVGTASTRPLPVVPVQQLQFQPQPGPVPVLQPAAISSVSASARVEAASAFSLSSFFADQTINIVASLGAFLVLVGSLSFVATTANLLLSFLVMFLVHAIFGTVGVVTYRFRSFRTVAAIYTAVFALLVPLVGFSGYRLIAGHLITLSTPTLIAIVASYAALTYGALAVYQRFQPFGFFAAISLIVTDLAIASANHLNFWWWSCLLMVLAFAALVAAPRQQAQLRLFRGSAAILLGPVRFLMVTCTLIGVIAVAVMPMGSLAIDGLHHPSYELRNALFLLSLCILVWFMLFIWLGKYKDEAIGIAYLFFYSTLLFSYMLDFQQTRYALALTLVAVLYHGLNRFSPRWLQPFALLREHMDGIALILVALVPFLATPFDLSSRLWSAAYGGGVTLIAASATLLACLALVLIGCVLTTSIVLRHTGLHGVLDKKHAGWPWFLLLSGFLFAWAWGVVTVTLGVVPVWSFLALSLLFVLAAIFTRRFIGTAWSNPLDVLALCTSFFTVSLSFSQSIELCSIVFFFFAALSYGMLLYQRRSGWLFLSLIFLLAVLPMFAQRPRVLFVAGLFLPFIAVIVHRYYTEHAAHAAVGSRQTSRPALRWEWPLLISGLIYSLVFLIIDYTNTTSIVQQWLGYSFPFVLELALISLAWYGAAALARAKEWLLVVAIFACLAVLVPTNTLTQLSWIAPTLVLCAFSVSRLADRDWAIPLYVSSLLAGIVIGMHGLQSGQEATVTLVLLGLAGVIFLLGIADDLILFLWVASGFAIWSLIYMAQFGQGIQLLEVALLCTAIGVITLLIHRVRPNWFMWQQHNRRVAYVLPLYAVAVAAAVLVGLFTLLSVLSSMPVLFATGILLAFIALTLCVLLIERVPELLVLPIGLALVTIAHMPWLFWQQMAACSILFVLVFAARFTWGIIPSATKLLIPQRLHELLAIPGQIVVVFVIAANGGLAMPAGILAHVGAGALLLLSGLVFWYGWLRAEPETRRWCLYVSGFLLSFVVTWEQIAFQQTRLDVLSLVPATYLIVVAPFISRDQKIVSRHAIGQVCSITGAALLLLPSLWFSFSQVNLQPTVILALESLALFIVGVSTHIRFFILSGAALLMVSAMHALFLPSLGIPPFVAMAILGMTLLLLATVLKLMSARIKVMWREAE